VKKKAILPDEQNVGSLNVKTYTCLRLRDLYRMLTLELSVVGPEGFFGIVCEKA